LDTISAISPEHQVICDQLTADGVRWASAVYPDVAGRPRGKVVPISRLADLAAGSERYTPRGLDGLGEMNPVEDECVTMPDLSRRFVLPWNPEVVLMPADLRQEDRAYDLCCRSILKRQLERASDLGFRYLLGVETEFYVFGADADGAPAWPLRPRWSSGDRHPSPAYLVDGAIDALGFLGPMVQAMDQIGFDVFSFDQEGGSGQYEFDFRHDEALAMADKLLLFRLMAKHFATAIGGVATFMPKPTAGSWGSGAHFNMSLEDENGRNLFRTDSREWTPLAQAFAAGILSHGRALAAITNPTVNSYKRLVDSLDRGGISWAPTWISIGDNNRSCMLRLPRNRPAIENRLVDSAANTYLAAAFLLSAGLDGIEQELTMPALEPGETYRWERSGDNRALRLPRTLIEAVDCFNDDPLSARTFPAGFVAEYSRMKELEWNEYHEIVSDWEHERYLTEL
jgi:glutamine synthetase